MIIRLIIIFFLSISFNEMYAQGSLASCPVKAVRPLRFNDKIVLKPGSIENSITGKSVIKSNHYLFREVNDDFWEENILIEKLSPLQFKFALLLDTTVESVFDLKLFEFIDEWLNTKYHLGGNTKKGIDCSGFSGLLMDSVYQIGLPRTARAQFKNCTRVEKEDLALGNLVFFNTRGGVSHVGVYLMNGFFVHSSTKQGVMISNIEENYYRKRFISGGIPEIESLNEENQN